MAGFKPGGWPVDVCPSMRSLSTLLLVAAVVQLSLTQPVAASADSRREPIPPAQPQPGSQDERAQDAEDQRREYERKRLAQAERIRAEQEAAIQAQRRLEEYREESVAETRRRVGGMGLAMSATTGCLAALSYYFDRKGVEAGKRSYRPMIQGLTGFSVVTGLLGTGFLVSGLLSGQQNVALDVDPAGRLLATVGWRFH